MPSFEFIQLAAVARRELLSDRDANIAKAAQDGNIHVLDNPDAAMSAAAGVKPGQILLGVYYCCPKTVILYENNIRKVAHQGDLYSAVFEVQRHELEHWVGYDHTKGYLTCAACVANV